MAAWRLSHPKTRTKNPFPRKRGKVAAGWKGGNKTPVFTPLGTDNVLSPWGKVGMRQQTARAAAQTPTAWRARYLLPFSKILSCTKTCRKKSEKIG